MAFLDSSGGANEAGAASADESDDEGEAMREYNRRTYTLVGTPEFIAPEVVAGTGHDTDAGRNIPVAPPSCELLTSLLSNMR